MPGVAFERYIVIFFGPQGDEQRIKTLVEILGDLFAGYNGFTAGVQRFVSRARRAAYSHR